MLFAFSLYGRPDNWQSLAIKVNDNIIIEEAAFMASRDLSGQEFFAAVRWQQITFPRIPIYESISTNSIFN